VPTVKESGFDVVLRKVRGLAGPKGLPGDIVAAWEKAIPQLLNDPEYKKVYGAESLVPDFIPHDAYVKFVNEFASTSETFLKETGAVK
jgi:putative tricarboxylic transport membrane protein